MKKTVFFLILHWVVGCLTIQAQLTGQIHVIPRSLTQEGDMMVIDMIFDMKYLRLRSVESITYTPIVVANTENYELPILIIKGSSRYKADLREEVLNKRPTVTIVNQGGQRNYPIYSIEKYNKNRIISYRVSFPYQAWMNNATISLREETCGCGNEQRMMTQRNIYLDEPLHSTHDIQPRFSYIVPEREFEKNRFDIGNAFLEFPQGGSTINPNFRNNQTELDKINRLISMLISDPDVIVTSIEMRGYASPEGSAQSNYDLSSQRAKAMRDYFVRRLLNIPSSAFLTGVGGEDWGGLKSLLMNYSVAYKDEIINIINTVQDLDVREQRIMRLGNGSPYRQIVRDLYPRLRRVDCQINYTARNFTVSESAERMKEKAKLLSQNEMYQIANTYPAGSSEFNRTLITAGQYFPNNDIANLNAAAAALTEGNPTLADNYLKNVHNTNSLEYANCMGVLAIYKGNYAAAESYLRKAQEGGLTEATHNLRELQKRRNQ